MTAMSRGFTLIETLVALALLTLITVGLVNWTRTVTSVQGVVLPRMQFDRDLNAVLRLIHDDIVTGDFVRGATAPPAARVRIDGDGHLVAETRDRGPVTRTYVFDRSLTQLHVVEQRGAQSLTRILVDGLQSWQCLMDAKTQIVQMEWQSVHGDGVRRVRVP